MVSLFTNVVGIQDSQHQPLMYNQFIAYCFVVNAHVIIDKSSINSNPSQGSYCNKTHLY